MADRIIGEYAMKSRGSIGSGYFRIYKVPSGISLEFFSGRGRPIPTQNFGLNLGTGEINFEIELTLYGSPAPTLYRLIMVGDDDFVGDSIQKTSGATSKVRFSRR